MKRIKRAATKLTSFLYGSNHCDWSDYNLGNRRKIVIIIALLPFYSNSSHHSPVLFLRWHRWSKVSMRWLCWLCSILSCCREVLGKPWLSETILHPVFQTLITTGGREVTASLATTGGREVTASSAFRLFITNFLQFNPRLDSFSPLGKNY